MNLTYIGIIALAIIAVGLLYFKIDGALLGTIIALIAGAAGFGVQKAKEQIAPSSTQFSVTSTNPDTKEVSLVNYSVPAKTPKLDDKVHIDFNQVDSEIQGAIKQMGLENTPEQVAALALNRAMGARISTLDEVKEWNNYLMDKALDAAGSLFSMAKPDSVGSLHKFVESYTTVGCKSLTEGQKVVMTWVNRLDGQKKALKRLEYVGIDWGKVADAYKTAWMVAELAYNPVVQIGIASEDAI